MFVNDDPRLCAAVAWWRELARASLVLLGPFAMMGAAAAWLGQASVGAYLAWLAVAAAGGVGLHAVRSLTLRRRVVYRQAAAGADVAPAQRLSRTRLAAVLVCRIWPAVAVLLSCHRSDQPGSVVSWLYAVSPQAATNVARLLFFYGWNTVIVFREGKAVARRDWEPLQARMEVSIHETVPER